MAEVVRYVDPDATGSGDGTSWTDAYTSLSAWETAEQTELASDGDWHHVYCRASSGTADTTAVVIDGWTTGASNYILIEAASGDEAVKDGWDTSRYRLDVDGSTAIENKESYVRIKGLQVRSTGSGAYVINTAYWGTNTSDIRISNCWIEGDGSTNDKVGVYGYDSPPDPTVSIWNCVIYNCYKGIRFSDASLTVYNSVIYGYGTNDFGIELTSDVSSATIKNCAIFNNDDDITDGTASATVDYNATDDGDGTNSVSPSGSDWDNEFSDPANGDFTLLNTGNLYDAGVGPSTDSDVPSTDIDGDSRSGSSCDIGVDEYVSGGTTHSITINDGFKLSDSPGGKLNLDLRLSDGINLSDVLAGNFTFDVTFEDGVRFSDVPATGGAVSIVIADGIKFADNITLAHQLLLNISDGVKFSDSPTGKLKLQATISDGVSFSDALSAAFKFVITLSDGAKFNDVAIESSSLAQGKLSVTISTKQINFTITSKQPGQSITSKQIGIDITGG